MINLEQEGRVLVPGGSGISPATVETGRDRVLFVLSSKERELFLPGASLDGFAAAETEFYPSCEYSEEAWLAMLGDYRPTILVTNWSSRPIPGAALRDENCRLRYICHMVGSVRHLIPRSFIEKGGIVSNWAGMAGTQVAEQALLLALSVLRGQGAWRGYLESPKTRGTWPSVDIGTRTLFSARVGIHGFGHVARTLVRLLKPFDAKIAAWSEGVPTSLFAEYEVTEAESLDDLFASNDIVFECEALNERTTGCVTADVLARLPDGAVLVNVGRGQIVQEDALLDEVKSGRIFAGLDVLADEGKTSSSPFLNLPNSIVSPHIGGPTQDQYPALGRFALANVERFLAGGEPEGLVNIDLYDRST